MKTAFIQILLFVFGLMPADTDAFTGFEISGGRRSLFAAVQASSSSSSGSSNLASVIAIQSVRKAISRLNRENFSETLVLIEPFLLDAAGASFYKKSMARIRRSAKALELKIPDGFAKEAKATAKARAKQEAFIQKKTAEAEAAALAAAVQGDEVTA